MSGSSGTNSWTILTSEETLKPVMTEHHEESHTGCEGNGHLAESVVSEADGLSMGDSLVQEQQAKLHGDKSIDHQTSVPTPVVDSCMPSSLEASSSVALSSESEGLALPTSDSDSFADTYTHIGPSINEPPTSVLSTETLGGIEPVQEPALYPLNEELHQEQEDSVASHRMTDFDNQTALEEKTEQRQGDEEPALRRRKRSLLATLEQIGRGEEEEGDQDFQLPRREEDSVFSLNKCILGAIILLGFGTIFLSGVFMVLDEERDYGIGEMNDSEVPGKDAAGAPLEPDRTELLKMLANGDQQLALLQTQLQAQEEQLKVVKGQTAEGVAERLHWAEVEQENHRLKEADASLLALQEENERLKQQLESVPILQKELDSLRSTGPELKSPSASEAASAFVKQTSLPPSGQSEHYRHGTAGMLERDSRKPQQKQWESEMEKYDLSETTEWKERKKHEWRGEKKDLKDRGKEEWKSRKREEKQKKHSEELKERKDGEWKKEKVSRGDEGKPWKAREGKEWKEMGERNGWKEDEDWKRGKQWKNEEKRDWKGAKDRKDEKERKKVKHGFEERKNNGEKREWKEGKDHREEWKERKKFKDGFQERGGEKDEGERKEWKKAGDWKNKDTRNVKEKGERKRWSENDWKGGSKDLDEEWRGEKRWHNGESKNDKRWKTPDKRKSDDGDDDDEEEERTLGKGAWSETKRAASKGTSRYVERKKDKNADKCEEEHGCTENQELLWRNGKPPAALRRASQDQPEYWVWQRVRLQHSPRRPMGCDTVETCAQAEGLIPVPLDQFETLLQEYLSKAEEAGLEASKRERLQKLSAEFFTDGVFVHDQISFQDFVEDLEDILEDLVEGEESDAGGEDTKGFEEEAMKRFLAEGARGSQERMEQGRGKESKRG